MKISVASLGISIPPVSVGGALSLGVSVADWVQIVALIWLVLQMVVWLILHGYRAYKWYKTKE